MQNLNPLIAKGICAGNAAFCGPQIVQIDLTGRCNNKCVGCWVHSPYIKHPPRDKNKTLNFKIAESLINDLAAMGTQEVILSGAGEPLLYPWIKQIISMIKEKGLRLNLISNAILLDSSVAKLLLNAQVDLLTVSIWAGNKEAYLRTHPGKNNDDFRKITDNLKLLDDLKLQASSHLPRIKIYHVICSLNYRDIHSMLDFALEVGAEDIEFQLIDTNKNTLHLALSPSNTEEIKRQFVSLKQHKNFCFSKLDKSPETKEKELKEFPGRFCRIPEGFKLEESIKTEPGGSKRAKHKLTCIEGFKSELYVDEEKNNLMFYQDFKKCSCCARFKNSCPVNNKGQLSLRFLKILGYGSLLRRLNISDTQQQAYDKETIKHMPCYTGWIYSRILATGEVIPCCKAAGKVLGRLSVNFLSLNHTFQEVWRSNLYNKFRTKAKNMPKDLPYFNKINCFKSCDNLGMNLKVSQALKTKGLETTINTNPGQADAAAYSNIHLLASSFSSGNLNTGKHNFGKNIVIDGGKGFGFAEYNLQIPQSGDYEIWAYYASGEIRPVEIYLDQILLSSNALGEDKGGWDYKSLSWSLQNEVHITGGKHKFKIITKGYIPHIHSFAFIKKGAKPPNNLDHQVFEVKGDGFIRAIKNIGIVYKPSKIWKYIKRGSWISDYLDIVGIFNGKYAFKGPHHVQIDLTDHCNNNCLACWCNSPLLQEKMHQPDQKHTLSLQLAKELLDELKAMGTKEIYFSGGGEPFCHPQIMEILAYAKAKGFVCYVNTNFTLLDKGKLDKLIDIGLDHLTVSTWAATPEVYSETHPNKSGETFTQIMENLKYLNKNKRRTPYVKLYNVIFNKNCHQLKEMVDFARDTKSESLEYTLVDTIPGKTENLLMDQAQIKELQKDVALLKSLLDKEGKINKVLLFGFDAFSRRVSSSNDLVKATYDRNIIDKIPCYIGWCFARILPNGDVNSCLKSHRIPAGNLLNNKFKDIWNGRNQAFFRKKTLTYRKNDPFFKSIGNDPNTQEAGCYKSCDDIGRNIYMYNRILALTYPERLILKLIAKIYPTNNSVQDNAKTVDPVIKGIRNGRVAFSGPEQVVIDITNRCNLRCVGCWLYSPLLKSKPSESWLSQEIDFSAAKKLIKSLSKTGVKRVRFTGGGEPFMHPQIMKLLRYTKEQGLICCLTTNFSMLSEEKTAELAQMQLDEIAVSLWAKDAETYQKLHPGSTATTFDKIKNNLILFNRLKKQNTAVTISNVICNINYRQLREMFYFAQNTGSDSVYYTLLDTVEGTEILLPNKNEIDYLSLEAEKLLNEWQALKPEKRPQLDNFEGFIRRLNSLRSGNDKFDSGSVNSIPCYAGWIFSRVLADGNIVPCCRGVNKVMGNTNSEDFAKIWHNHLYNSFRSKAKYLDKNAAYFTGISCSKMCDNLMHNQEMHRRLNAE